MKLKKRFFALLLLSILTLQLSFTASATQAISYYTTTPIPLTYDNEILALNESSSPADSPTLQSNLEKTEQAYSNMFHSFYSSLPDGEKYKEGVYTVSGIPAGGFPDSYAGAYVNPDLNLVVLLSSDTTKSRASLATSQKLLSDAADSSSLIYATAQYSYNDLVSAMNDIHQYHLNRVDDTTPVLFNIKYFAIDDYNNCVIVALDDISSSAINSFKSLVSDSPVINFILDTSDNQSEDTTLKPGGAIDNGSVAFRIYKQVGTNYIEGFLTAYHCYPSAKQVFSGTTIVADTDVGQASGNMDAIFCILRPGHSVSTTISYIGGTLRNAIDVNFAQGDPVTMVGQSSKGVTGTIKNSSYAYTYRATNTYFYDLGAADYDRQSGDSGGIVISTRTGYNYIAGIHRGLDGQYSIFTKAINVTTGLGLTFNDGSNL